MLISEILEKDIKTTSVLEHKNGWIFRMHIYIYAPIKYVLGFELIYNNIYDRKDK